jgi:hypothetical protein
MLDKANRVVRWKHKLSIDATKICLMGSSILVGDKTGIWLFGTKEMKISSWVNIPSLDNFEASNNTIVSSSNGFV